MTQLAELPHDLEHRYILGMRVDATSYRDAAQRIVDWGRLNESRYVCIASVNNVMEAYDDASFMTVMNDADLVTPDGMPLVWGLKLLGVENASRTYGPTLTPILLSAAEDEGVKVGFYGGSPSVLDTLMQLVEKRWPNLQVSFAVSPPYRPLEPEEERALIDDVTSSGTQILLVGLGCPKQERLMAALREEMPAVMVGVGAAFDFLAGAKRQAPSVMQRTGTEWVFRLLTEPRRLWRRYLKHNPRFAAQFSAQLVRQRVSQRA